MAEITLLPWQKRWRSENVHKRVIWADTGLGKGVLGGFLVNSVIQKGGKTLIVCPSHLKGDWELKIQMFGEFKNVTIISYNALQRDDLKIKSLDFLIIDESHRIKNYKSVTFKKLLKIVKNTNPYTLCLSATPITKNRLDLLPQIFLSQPTLRAKYTGMYDLLREVAIAKDKYFGSKKITIYEDVRPEYFNKFLTDFVFRVSYESEGIEKPKYIVEKITIDCDDIAKEAINSYLDAENILNNPSFESDKMLNKIANPHSVYLQAVNGFIYNEDKSVINCGLTGKIEKMSEVLSESDKILVLYFYEAEKGILSDLFKKEYFYKPNSKKTIETQIKEFESGDYSVFFAGIASIGEGIRFKNTSTVVILTEQYDYGRILQALGRIQYVGNDTSRILRAYLFQNTFEFSKQISQNLAAKAGIIFKNEEVLNG